MKRSPGIRCLSLWLMPILAAFSVTNAPIIVHATDTNSNAAAYAWTTLAGYSLSSSSDGVGPQARFNLPGGIASDTNGNFFVVDQLNLTIRRISAAGVVSTIAGLTGVRGDADGIGSAARFYDPQYITADHSGNLFVTDNFMVRKISPVGTNWLVTSIVGQLNVQGYRDGYGIGTRFLGPSGLAADNAGNIYVADGAVRKINFDGTNWVVSTVANSLGYTLIENRIPPPLYFTNYVGVFAGSASAIAVDRSGNLFVSDAVNEVITELTLVGTNWVATTIAGVSGTAGSVDGIGASASFLSPGAIAADGLGNVYVADDGYTIRALTPQGTNWVVSTVAGSPRNGGNADGVGTNALFNGLAGVAVDGANNLLVTDSGNNEVRKVTSAGLVSTIAGTVSVSHGSVDGVGGNARFYFPAGVAVDHAGNVYVADRFNDTIRVVSSAGNVSTLAGSVLNAGTNDGVGSDARFTLPDGVAVDHAGNVFVADNGSLRRITPAAVVTTIPGVTATDVAVDSAGNILVIGNGAIQQVSPVGTNWTVSTIVNVDGSALAVANDGRLFIASGSEIQQLALVGTNWIASYVAGLTAYHLAVDGAGNIYIGSTISHTVMQIAPVGTNWVVNTIGGSPGTNPYFLGGNADGVGTNASFEVTYGFATDSAGNVYVSDPVNDNIRKGVATFYAPSQAIAFTPPPMNGQLTVMLSPPTANGQWHLPWELGWHNSGDTVSNLVAGNYTVEFRNVTGWLAIPPAVTGLVVTNNSSTTITNQYYPTAGLVDTNFSGGTLTVNLGINPPAGAGWRFIGNGGTYLSSGYSTNLAAGNYLIEFAAVSGRNQPGSLSLQVTSGQTTSVSVSYLLASAAPANVYLPFLVPTNNLSNLSQYPFGFNGQLQSDLGYGSGVAVNDNVVLTAAHLIFNDQTLSYVSQVYWFFQREAGTSEPLPQAARGWYVLSGYAAQRTNDLQNGYSPDQSTPPSRNLDVAALYFLQPVAGGGQGGYLPSDAVPNTWLSSAALKMLVGYPVDGSQFGVNLAAGQMYQTDPQPYPLSLASDPVPGQQEVYQAPWFLSFPGNSGGPLYVQLNGYYYPAAVYLGTLFSGSTPYASIVRAIDSSVVNLITNAQVLGDSGTNGTGGGVTVLSSAAFAGTGGYMQWQLGPSSALKAGAAWQLAGRSTFSTATNYTEIISSTNFVTVHFKSLPGWQTPSDQAVSVPLGYLTTYTINYTVSNPVLAFDPATGLGFSGTTGTVYQIEISTNLAVGGWTSISTNTISGSGFNLFIPKTAFTNRAGFYRAVWLEH